MTLFELINSSPENLQSALKRVFMPYSTNIDVDGYEAQALTILLNLCCRNPTAKDLLDVNSAQRYFANGENIKKGLSEIKWYHTHNLKYPDCRVKDQRIVAFGQEADLNSQQLGWAHNSACYAHTIWLLNPFNWQGKSTSLLQLIQCKEPLWSRLLENAGLSQALQEQCKAQIDMHLQSDSFPNRVSPYCGQVRMPFAGDYLSITPVVNHMMQVNAQLAYRAKNTSLRFNTLLLPKSASIGNLCGSVGGRIQLIFAPSGCKQKPQLSLVHSIFKHQRFFDDYALTNKKICAVLSHLIGQAPLKSAHQRKHVRHYQLLILRKQIALWLMPLLELKEALQGKCIPDEFHYQDEFIQEFINQDDANFVALAPQLNLRIHETLQSNRFTHKFAYHPKLFTAVKAQIKWVLRQLSAPLEDEEHKDDQYIHLSSMRADQINAVSSPFTIGVPSMTALYGFAHRFERQIQQQLPKGEEIKLISFAFFIRSEYIYSSANLTEPNSVSHKSQISSAKRPTIRKSFFSDLEFDLILKVKCSVSLKEQIDRLKACLPNTFAGGVIYPPLISNGVEWLQVHQSRFVLYHHLNLLPQSGRWITPALKQVSTVEEIDLAIETDSSQLPVAVGFRLLEEPKFRVNSTAPLHAYAENMLGMAKRVSPIEFRLLDRNIFFENAFWQLKVISNSVLVTKSEENDDAIM